MNTFWMTIDWPQLWFCPCLWDIGQSQGAVVKQFIRQSPLRCPSVCLWVIALKIVWVLNDVVAIDITSANNVEFVVENGGRVVHPPLLQVGTLDEPVGFGVICDHSPGVSCDRGDIHLRVAAWVAQAECSDVTLQSDSSGNKSILMKYNKMNTVLVLFIDSFLIISLCHCYYLQWCRFCHPLRQQEQTHSSLFCCPS